MADAAAEEKRQDHARYTRDGPTRKGEHRADPARNGRRQRVAKPRFERNRTGFVLKCPDLVDRAHGDSAASFERGNGIRAEQHQCRDDENQTHKTHYDSHWRSPPNPKHAKNFAPAKTLSSAV
jgi:hypothetical protein